MKNLRNFISKLFNNKPAQVQGVKSMSSNSSPIVNQSRVNTTRVHELTINEYTKKLLEQIKLELENDYKALREQEKNMTPLTIKYKEVTRQLNIIAENLNKINIELKNREELYDSTILMLKEHNILQFSRVIKSSRGNNAPD